MDINYEYDDLGQLVRENNPRLGKTYLYFYDNAGNLTERWEVPYTTQAVQRPSNTDENTNDRLVVYTYGNSTWGDLLTAYDNEAILYDAAGYPYYYAGRVLTWAGGRLTSLTKQSHVHSYEYDANGLRIQREAGGSTYRYLYDGGTLVRIEREAQDSFDYLDFLFDGQSLVGFRYCNPSLGHDNLFYYVFGHGGNVEAIVDEYGNVLVQYVYDAWGNFSETPTYTYYTSPLYAWAITLSPLRYRGYVYDYETGFYYLQSRYYDPKVGRFISPDDVSSLHPYSINGLNLYGYANNNPLGIANGGSVFSGSTGGGMVNSIMGSVGRFSSGGTAMGGANLVGNVDGSGKSHINWPKTNSVLMTNKVVFSLVKDPIMAGLIGNITYTVTTQHNPAETFYSFTNVSKDGYSVGVGMNLSNWYGASVYVSSDIGFGSSWQLTPWLTGSSGWSLENGISISGGVIIGDSTHEIAVSIGNGTLAGYAICGLVSTIPIPGARTVAATAACIIFVVDLFN